MKKSFNETFDQHYNKKQEILTKISNWYGKMRKLLTDLNKLAGVKALVNPTFSPEEQPELLLRVGDDEITVEKHLSPAQLAEIEAKRLAEEERRRKELMDNWRERGLEEMMGGVLEIRKEDELKKDVPKPHFLVSGKPLAHWTDEDKRMYGEYERKVKELIEEREKYRKVCYSFLENSSKCRRHVFLSNCTKKSLTKGIRYLKGGRDK